MEMKKLDGLLYHSNVIIGADSMVLLDAIIDLHNAYIDTYQKQNGNYKIKWYGGMRLTTNDLCTLTGLKRDRANSCLKKLCEGITYNNNTFVFLEMKGKGYYSINTSELDRLKKCVKDHKTEWHRYNDTWESENGSELFSIDDIIKTLAKENLSLLEKRFRERLDEKE